MTSQRKYLTLLLALLIAALISTRTTVDAGPLVNPYVFGGGAPYSANGVTFDGTNDYLDRGAELTGNADSKVGLFSAWVKFDSSASESEYLFTVSSGYFSIQRRNTDLLQIQGFNASATEILRARTTATFDDTDGWIHILMAWDMADGPRVQIYVNDADDTDVIVSSDDTFDYTRGDSFIGAHPSGTSGFVGADVADFYLNLAETLDLSTTANRRKFIDSSGKPVDLGSDGSSPTGNAPIVFLHGDTATWHTNDGPGGGYTENGALTDAGSSPSD